MKPALLLLATICLSATSCTSPPPVSGSIANRYGALRLLPHGRVEIVVEPRSAK